jgi:hypothetical protein
VINAFLRTKALERSPAATIAAGWTAVVLSSFMAVLIGISRSHANNDYTRSHKVLTHAKELLPKEIFEIIRDEEGQHRSSLLLPERWQDHFRYIGRQFMAMMDAALLLVMISFLVALGVTLSVVLR